MVPEGRCRTGAYTDTVIGELFLPAAATVIMAGLQLAGEECRAPARNRVAPLALMAGIGVLPLAELPSESLHPVIGEMIGHSIVVSAVVAIMAEIVLVMLSALRTSTEKLQNAEDG